MAAVADAALDELARGCSRAMADDAALEREAAALVARHGELRGWVSAARAARKSADDVAALALVRDARARAFDAPALARFGALSPEQRAALSWCVAAAPRDGGGGWTITHLDFSASKEAPARVHSGSGAPASPRWLRALAGLMRFADVWDGGPYAAEEDDDVRARTRRCVWICEHIYNSLCARPCLTGASYAVRACSCGV